MESNIDAMIVLAFARCMNHNLIFKIVRCENCHVDLRIKTLFEWTKKWLIATIKQF